MPGTAGGKTGVTLEGFFVSEDVFFDFLVEDDCGSSEAAVFVEVGGTGGTMGVCFTAFDGKGSTAGVLELSTRAFLDFLAGVGTAASLLGVAFSTSPCLRFFAGFGVSDLALAEPLSSGGAWVISTSSSSPDASTPRLPLVPLTPNGW